MNSKTAIINAVDAILSKGTRVVSFVYGNKVRNVLVGANAAAEGTPRWGETLNRALRVNGRDLFLVGIDNNDGHTIKTFNILKIENPCAALA